VRVFVTFCSKQSKFKALSLLGGWSTGQRLAARFRFRKVPKMTYVGRMNRQKQRALWVAPPRAPDNIIWANLGSHFFVRWGGMAVNYIITVILLIAAVACINWARMIAFNVSLNNADGNGALLFEGLDLVVEKSIPVFVFVFAAIFRVITLALTKGERHLDVVSITTQSAIRYWLVYAFLFTISQACVFNIPGFDLFATLGFEGARDGCFAFKQFLSQDVEVASAVAPLGEKFLRQSIAVIAIDMVVGNLTRLVPIGLYVKRFMKKRKVASTKALQALYIPPEFTLQKRIAVAGGVMLMIMVYSHLVPALFLLGFLWFGIGLVVDRIFLLRIAHQPHQMGIGAVVLLTWFSWFALFFRAILIGPGS